MCWNWWEHTAHSHTHPASSCPAPCSRSHFPLFLQTLCWQRTMRNSVAPLPGLPSPCAVLCCAVMSGLAENSAEGGLSLCTSCGRGNGVWQGSAASVTVRSSSQDSSSSCWVSCGQCSFTFALTLTRPSCSFSRCQKKHWGNTVSAGKEKLSATL